MGTVSLFDGISVGKLGTVLGIQEDAVLSLLASKMDFLLLLSYLFVSVIILSFLLII
ncbi:hypothetical protein [Carnobacterium sp.]|uniref:hypothetical protein n=1 Tax=Carnobacterium sp. TaxID=48221 RepID=UPI002FCB4DE0